MKFKEKKIYLLLFLFYVRKNSVIVSYVHPQVMSSLYGVQRNSESWDESEPHTSSPVRNTSTLRSPCVRVLLTHPRLVCVCVFSDTPRHVNTPSLQSVSSSDKHNKACLNNDTPLTHPLCPRVMIHPV